MIILKQIFQWFLEWALGVAQKLWAEHVQDKKEEGEVDAIEEKLQDPDLGKQLEGVEDAEDRFNRNT